jgi:hypothetical protein
MEFTSSMIQEMLSVARDEQKELYEWLKIERKQDTLTQKNAENLYGLLIASGFSTLKSLYNITWEIVENMNLSQELMTWLSVWLPNSYNEYPQLMGVWEDSMGGRRCTIKPDESDESKTCMVKEENSKKADGKIGMDYEDPNNVILTAPWGKNGEIRTWRGKIENGATQIRWYGRRGESFWYKITE